jgi:hypothetical protein
MILSPRLSASATLSGLSGGALSFGAVPDDIVTALAPFFVGDPGPQGEAGPQGEVGPQGEAGPQGETGPQGESWQRTFETVAQGLEGYDYVINRAGGAVSTIVYDLGGGLSITKTLGRVGGVLTTITLSGDTPAGIDLVKTLTRDGGGNVTGATYGSA